MSLHQFTPSIYHTALGPYEPILRMSDGDTVKTTTVDSDGYDAAGQRVAAPDNAQTGPFYIEGAEPGDTLAVHLDHLWPNRRQGFTAMVVAPNVVDPEYVLHLPPATVDGEWAAQWEIDLTQGTATLVEPQTKLGRFTLPLEPMLGCFGVAPPGGQAISTVTSGAHGGNMDYRGFGAGVTVYFPVFVPGALFFLGDGHAAQGDGEIVGTGIEISCDVQFTVHVRKGKRITWPRAENEDFIITVGNARPLDQALQHATTEMLRWLQEDYGLDARGACTLLGQCVRYEVGNVFDPAYTMVAKVAKGLLP